MRIPTKSAGDSGLKWPPIPIEVGRAGQGRRPFAAAPQARGTTRSAIHPREHGEHAEELSLEVPEHRSRSVLLLTEGTQEESQIQTTRRHRVKARKQECTIYLRAFVLLSKQES
jgi:hypothetical protein